MTKAIETWPHACVKAQPRAVFDADRQRGLGATSLAMA
jgi:hypothetical protein